MPLAKNLIEAAGNATQANYIEDVFSTYLYTGTGAAQTITNNIDLSTKGGMVWTKCRSAAFNNALHDTARGAKNYLVSDTTGAQANPADNTLTSFSTSGYAIGASSLMNSNTQTYVGWSFAKATKFFDVVTYTGNGTSQNIAHNLGSVPGCIMVKATSDVSNWFVYHRSLGNANLVYLNATSASASTTIWNSTDPTSTQFSINGTSGNASGVTYVAYIFAHDAGGFGLTGTDNVISCGSYTEPSSGSIDVNLGFEPQWLLVKRADSTSNWYVMDNMRGWPVGSGDAHLYPNLSNAEATGGSQYWPPYAQGFSPQAGVLGSGATVIYIAIRRGPMKVPTDGTKVFLPQLANTSAPTYRASFTIDMVMALQRTVGSHYIGDRLRGAVISDTTSTAAEAAYANEKWDYQTSALAYASDPIYEVGQCFKRAPSFFDEVCYTGTGTAMTVSHNLGVAPELMIVKSRSTTNNWPVYVSAVGNTNNLFLNTTAAADVPRIYWNNTTPTASVFSLGNSGVVSNSGGTYVAYLFATCAGVSKVGNYTGTGTTKQIDCGFAAGARFVLIKRTDSTGDWYVWDTARGIVSGNDPYLLLNSTAAETTTTDYIDTYSAGFELSSTAPAALNASGGTYIFLAIA